MLPALRKMQAEDPSELVRDNAQGAINCMFLEQER